MLRPLLVWTHSLAFFLPLEKVISSLLNPPTQPLLVNSPFGGLLLEGSCCAARFFLPGDITPRIRNMARWQSDPSSSLFAELNKKVNRLDTSGAVMKAHGDRHLGDFLETLWTKAWSAGLNTLWLANYLVCVFQGTIGFLYCVIWARSMVERLILEKTNNVGVDTGTSFLGHSSPSSSLYIERSETFFRPSFEHISRDQHHHVPNPLHRSFDSSCSMGSRHCTDDPSPTTVSSSSIALLQERFRELQRVKQRREEREMMRLSREAELVEALVMNPDRQAKFPLQPNMSSCSSPQDYCSLSLGLTTHATGDKSSAGVGKTNPRMSFWPGNNSRAISGTSNIFESPDVDTSLHL